MIRFLGATLLMLLSCVGPAWATSTLSCNSSEGAHIDMAMGSVPVAAIVRASIEIGDMVWTTDSDIGVGQQFDGNDTLTVDFTDPNIERILARLRLFRATEGESFAMAGTLTVSGVGAFAVICDEP